MTDSVAFYLSAVISYMNSLLAFNKVDRQFELQLNAKTILHRKTGEFRYATQFHLQLLAVDAYNTVYAVWGTTCDGQEASNISATYVSDFSQSPNKNIGILCSMAKRLQEMDQIYVSNNDEGEYVGVQVPHSAEEAQMLAALKGIGFDINSIASTDIWKEIRQR